MLFAFISDIHANLHALDTVLEDLEARHPDRVICLGDLVGYGAYPNDVTIKVREIADVVLAGNHDHAAVGLQDITWFNQYAYKAALWTRETLTGEHHAYLRGLPFTHEEENLFFCHAGPLTPEAWPYIYTDLDAAYAMANTPHATVFVGHTHVPNDHRTRQGRLINVGSVGQPRDGDTRAAYTLFDTTTGARELIRLEYDVAAAAQAILDAGLPGFLADRLQMGR